VQLELHMRMEHFGWSLYYLVTSLTLLQKVAILSDTHNRSYFSLVLEVKL
jgi:hypothetical protein